MIDSASFDPFTSITDAFNPYNDILHFSYRFLTLTLVRLPGNTKLFLGWGPYEFQLNSELKREQNFYQAIQ